MNHRVRNEQQNVLTRTPTETTPSTPINSVCTCSATGQEKGMKAKESATTTLQYRATTSKAGYSRIQDALLQMGHLRNALIRHRDSARGSHRHAFSLKLQNAHLTDLHRHDPDLNTYARRLLESVAREVNKSYSTYFKHPDVGRPRTASPYRNRTLEISEPTGKQLKFSKKGWATITIKGLPIIKFKSDSRLPNPEQPKGSRIPLKPPA